MLYTLIDDDDLVAGCHERNSVMFPFFSFFFARRHRRCGIDKIEIFLSVALPFSVSCEAYFFFSSRSWPMENEMNTTKDESDLNAKCVVSNTEKEKEKNRNRKVHE